jgi:hypothetical protein
MVVRPSILYAACLFCLAPAMAQQEQVRWKKSIAPDNSLSLHYPDTWVVKHDRGGVSLRNPPFDEQIIAIRKPREVNKSATVYAQTIAASFQQAQSSFHISNLTTAGENVGFALTYSSGAKEYTGIGVVVMQPRSAFWVSYVSPNAANLARGGALLTAIADSLSDNAGSVMPRQPSVPIAAGGRGPAPTGPPVAQTPPAPVPQGPPGTVSLVGKWSTTSYFGDLVDRQGSFVAGAYSGQWYEFLADGSYKYNMFASGNFISGLLSGRGRYEVRGGQLVLHQKETDWTPLPRSAKAYPANKNKPEPKEIVLILKVNGSDEINLHESTANMSDTFRRAPK